MRMFVCPSVLVGGSNLVVTGEWVQSKVGADARSAPAVHDI